MALGIFDLFKVGIGPSSSHTVGPMLAAGRFLGELDTLGLTGRVRGVAVHLYGSLALTGRGHATDKAVILGLAGETPDRIDPDRADAMADEIRKCCRLNLSGAEEVAFDAERDIHFHMDEILDAHPNGLRFQARDGTGAVLLDETYYSVGGGSPGNRRRDGSLHRRHRARERNGLAQRERDPGRPGRHLGRHGGLHRARLQ